MRSILKSGHEKDGGSPPASSLSFAACQRDWELQVWSSYRQASADPSPQTRFFLIFPRNSQALYTVRCPYTFSSIWQNRASLQDLSFLSFFILCLAKLTQGMFLVETTTSWDEEAFKERFRYCNYRCKDKKKGRVEGMPKKMHGGSALFVWGVMGLRTKSIEMLCCLREAILY